MSSNDDKHLDLNDSYGYVLATVLHKFGKGLDDALKIYSIDSKHYRVLITIYSNKYINQKKLAEALGIDRTTMVHLIDHIEKEGYVERQKNPEDRRSFKLVLTNKGNSVINPVCKLRDETHEKCLNELTENEKRVFREICKKIGED